MARREAWLLILLALANASVSCAVERDLDWATVDALIAEEFTDIPHLTAAELSGLLETPQRVILLDAREADEYAVSHLRHAQLASTPEAAEAVLTAAGVVRGEDATGPVIVAYCSVGYRSAALVEALRDRGFRNVVNLQRSIFGWANAGYPVYRDGGIVEQVHPFDRQWGRLLEPQYSAFELDPAAASTKR